MTGSPLVTEPLLARNFARVDSHATLCSLYRRHRRSMCLVGVLLLLTTVLSVVASERPALRVRQLLQPLQWFMISSGSYTENGYDVVMMPPDLHGKLTALLNDRDRRHVRYGGDGEPLEDVIIFGQTERISIPRALQAEMREAFRPLVAKFCNCELEEDATVGGGGVRVYRRGATLATHLDWAHKFVVSATINVKQASNKAHWPLTMRALGGTTRAVTHAEGWAVLYEGSRMMHGRPLPLEDDYYAAAFVGFVPKAYPEGRWWSTRLYVELVRYMNS